MAMENEEENNALRRRLYRFCNPVFISNMLQCGYLV